MFGKKVDMPICPLLNKPCIKEACMMWIHVRGKNPNTGNDEDKPVCSQCRIHCYKPQMKERIGKVMRYAGPKMIYRHPIMAIRHLIVAKRPVPAAPPRAEQ